MVIDFLAGAHRDPARTRERILEAARRSFTRHGYGGTTVRGVALEAGVAPNLITRYFGGKAGLFRAATAGGLQVRAVLAGPYSELGARIAAKVVAQWEGAASQEPLLMMLRSAGSSDEAANALGQFFDEQAARPLAAHVAAELGCSRSAARDRVAAVGVLILGVVTTRYVMRTGPLASADTRSLEAWLADRLQRLLDDPAPPALRPERRHGGGHAESRSRPAGDGCSEVPVSSTRCLLPPQRRPPG
ncbi:MAG: TetR family transcriptional regulator [Actinomycetota bacterium]|jgi:AcrR family transcriptional regulator|nr:TetR family transcriptional regulator [Actinomycetota bacterium]